MPSLKDLLQRTLLFTAAHDPGGDAYTQCKVGAAQGAEFSPPTSLNTSAAAEDCTVWGWKHSPEAPARVTNLSAFVPAAGMPMTACDSIEVESVTVTINPGDDPVSLPVTSAFVAAKFVLSSGHVTDKSRGWWQLPANVDPSLLVVFAYQLVPASGAAPKPLSLERIEALGSRFFPVPDVDSADPDAPDTPLPPTDRPDASVPPAKAAVGQSVTAYVAPTWVIVAFGLTTCKQRADFEPGGILGAGRVYPHVMVSCNQPLASAETKIRVTRPAKTMQHDPEMQSDIGAILVADTNELHATLSHVPGVPPFPVWSNFFDYYDLSPPIGTEFVCVDPARKTSRVVQGGILREKVLRITSIYEDASPFTKAPRQGDYDNMHLAPKMLFHNRATGTVIPNIAMAPFCIHDCLHTHFRWGNPTTSDPPKSNIGFEGRKPYARAKAPLVPSNQTVSIKLSSAHSFVYRAVASGPIRPATWTVFYHHGSAYALAIGDTIKFGAARFSVAGTVIQLIEPYTTAMEIISPFFDRTIDDVDPMASIAAFYQRLQFTGTPNPNIWMPRIKILDLDRCRRS